jgi:hypothetical protein
MEGGKEERRKGGKLEKNGMGWDEGRKAGLKEDTTEGREGKERD